MQPMPAMFAAEGRPTPFSKTLPNLQVLWDSTSLGWLKQCPRYYQLRMLQGWETKMGSIHLRFGILYHKALELYDKARINGTDHEAAQHIALQHVMENTVEHFTAWKCGNCGRVWRDETHEYCPACRDDKDPNSVFTTFRDTFKEIPQKGRLQLARAIIWYTEQFKDDPIKTIQLDNGEAAVELSFTLPLDFGPEGSDEHYALRGHLDRAAENDMGIWIVDKKTTKSTMYASYFDQFSPDNQVTLYTLAGKVILGIPIQGVIIDAGQMAVSFVRFGRGYIHRTESQLEEWLEDLGDWLAVAERYAKREHWPMNEKSCGMYGGCPFRHVCGKSPEVRQKYLENDFVQSPWNPAEDR